MFGAHLWRKGIGVRVAAIEVFIDFPVNLTLSAGRAVTIPAGVYRHS
jgi:hypothetical protein